MTNSLNFKKPDKIIRKKAGAHCQVLEGIISIAFGYRYHHEAF